jgi:hypothetical protein
MRLKLLGMLFVLALCAISTHAQQGPPSVTMSWGAVTVPTPASLSYVVQRATAQAGPFTTVTTVASTVLKYTDLAVTRGTTYFYQLLSSCPAIGTGCGTTTSPINGNSVPSNVISAAIPSATTLPPTPTLTLDGLQ